MSVPGIRSIDDLFTGWRCKRQLFERLVSRKDSALSLEPGRAHVADLLDPPGGSSATHQFLEKIRVRQRIRDELRQLHPGLVQLHPGAGELLLQREAGAGDLSGSPDYSLGILDRMTRDCLDKVSCGGCAGVINGILLDDDGRVSMLDLVLPGESGALDLYLVKASAKVKDGYYQEGAWLFQRLASQGYPVGDVHILYLDRGYTPGETRLWRQERIRRRHVSLKRDMEAECRRLEQELDACGGDPARLEPCNQLSCSLCSRNSEVREPEPSILHLHRAGNLGRQILDLGIRKLENLDEVAPPLRQKLRTYHWIQHRALRENREQIDRDKLARFMDTLVWPLYFLDFECVLEAIPQWSNAHIWEHQPFLFSLFGLEKGGDPVKKGDYLIPPGMDSRREMAERLLSLAGSSGSILVYGLQFEKAILLRLAQALPGLKADLESLSQRLVDLQTPFLDFAYHHPGQKGRIGLKIVLPLLTGLDYDQSQVSSGSEAFAGYYYLMNPSIPVPAEWDPYAREVRRNPEGYLQQVVDYCDLDAAGLAHIIQALEQKLSQ